MRAKSAKKPRVTLEWVRMPDGVYFRTICHNGIPIPDPTRFLLSYAHPGAHSTETVRTYGNWLLPFFKWLDLRKLSLTDVAAVDLSRFRRDLQKVTAQEREGQGRLLRNGPDSANTTIYHVTATARRFIAWAMEPDDVQALIRRGKNKPTLRRRLPLPRLTLDDMELFAKDAVPRRRRDLKRHLSQVELNACRDWIMAAYGFSPDLQLRNRAIFELLCDGALRKGALLGLRLSNIGWSDGTVLLSFSEEDYRAAWYRKRANYRTAKTKEYEATISDQTVQWLRRYWEEGRPAEAVALGHDIFFCEHDDADRGHPLSVDTLRWLFEALSKPTSAGGVGFHVTPHMLRHTWATLAIKDGVPIETVKHQLGHVSILTTQEYCHVMPEDAREILNRWRHQQLHRHGEHL